MSSFVFPLIRKNREISGTPGETIRIQRITNGDFLGGDSIKDRSFLSSGLIQWMRVVALLGAVGETISRCRAGEAARLEHNPHLSPKAGEKVGHPKFLLRPPSTDFASGSLQQHL